MRVLCATLIAFSLAGAGCAPERDDGEPRVTVDEAWVRLPAAPGRPGSAYFKLHSNQEATRLTHITSPQAERVELHDSRVEGGMTRMVPLDPAEAVFDGGRLVFEPGGKHAMLFGLDPTLRPGDRVSLAFHFEPAPSIDVAAHARGPGGELGHDRH